MGGMLLKLFYNSEVEPYNSDLTTILTLMREVGERGVPCESIDTKNLAKSELFKYYLHACTPSIHKRYKIRRIFGTRRQSGIFFGKEQPALIVYKKSNRIPDDVFPHEACGQVRGIADFLRRLLFEIGEGKKIPLAEV